MFVLETALKLCQYHRYGFHHKMQNVMSADNEEVLPGFHLTILTVNIYFVQVEY